MNQRVGNLTFLKKGLGKVLMSGAIVWPKIHGWLQEGDSFVQFTLSQKDDPEIIFGDIIVCGYGKGMPE